MKATATTATKKTPQPLDHGASMRMVRILVTPVLATQWLEKNFGNRPLRQANVDFFVHMLRATGRLASTHQGIAFSPTMKLLDGQHRLYAIIETGISAYMWVCFDQPEEDASYIDSGKPRSIADRIHIELGKAVSDRMAAAARVMAFSPLYGGISKAKFRDAKEASEFIGKHHEALQFAFDAFGYRQRLVCAVERAVVARAYYSQDLDDLRRFCRIYSTGVAEGNEEDTLVIMIREAVNKMPHLSNSSIAPRYAKFERMLYAFLKREPLSRVTMAKDELFLMPEETLEGAETHDNSHNQHDGEIFDVLNRKWISK